MPYYDADGQLHNVHNVMVYNYRTRQYEKATGDLAMNKTLWSINQSIQAFGAKIADGELTPELEAEWDGLEVELNTKIAGTVRWTQQERATADLIKAKAKALVDQANAIQAKCDRLDAFVMRIILEGGNEPRGDEVTKVKVKENPASVVIDGEVPETFLRHKPTPPPEPDKKAIKAAIEAGEVVPGAHLERTKKLVEV